MFSRIQFISSIKTSELHGLLLNSELISFAGFSKISSQAFLLIELLIICLDKLLSALWLWFFEISITLLLFRMEVYRDIFLTLNIAPCWFPVFSFKKHTSMRCPLWLLCNQLLFHKSDKSKMFDMSTFCVSTRNAIQDDLSKVNCFL
jgi:hypothetical protein